MSNIKTPVSALVVANSFLFKAQSYEVHNSVSITPLKLQCLIVLLSERYKKKTGTGLIGEKVLNTEYGIRIPSVDSYFSCFNERNIPCLYKDASNSSFCLTGKVYEEIFEEIWDKYAKLSGIELWSTIRALGSA